MTKGLDSELIHKAYLNAAGQHCTLFLNIIDSFDDFYNMYDGCFFE